MTTQNTHHEEYDVNTDVVEYSSVPGSTADPDATGANHPSEPGDLDSSAIAKTALPEEQTSSSASEPTASNGAEEEKQDTIPTIQGEEQSVAAKSEQQEAYTIAVDVSADSSSQGASAQETIEGDTPYTYTTTTTMPLSEVEAEVRPFTDFIEEFRQAEARLHASVQESGTEVFHTIIPVDATPPEQEKLVEVYQLVEGISLEPVFESIDEARAETVIAFPQESPTLAIPETSSESHVSEEKESTAVAETPEIIETKVTNEAPITQEESAAEETTTSRPAERAVSPLLRPPSPRSRLPRHATIRHQQREAFTEAQPAQDRLQGNKQEEIVPSTPADSVMPALHVEAATSAIEEKPAEVEKPRPARRYRFDRPASSNNKTPAPSAVSARIEENHPAVSASTTRNENTPGMINVNTEAIVKPAVAGVSPRVEQQNMKPPIVPEAPVQEGANSVVNVNQEHSRRRQPHERSKEPITTVMPVAEAPVPVTETSVKPKEIAPEDLPPLEYSELQKVSSRRRRRHRSGPNSGVPAPTIQPVTPTIQPAPPAIQSTPAPRPATAAPTPAIRPADNIAPVTAATPTSAAPYTIVSGYTVNQMNQGNEASGPFMAPEPSPARGSLITREGRVPSRSEVQRGPAPTYPHVRPTSETGLTSAALNHFGNTISQAIQTQTDRMVAELHRATQTPANISVTLPPFPSTERVGVFVDVANLLYSARTLNLAVDFGKLLDFLRGNRRLIRAQAYCPTSPQPGAEQMFLQAVKGLGYRITTKNYKTFSSGAKKADLDLDLCMDIVRLVDGRAVDCIILVSGDSDFMPLLDYCSDHGVRVEVAAFDEAMSATLRQSCDLFINLSMLDEVLVRA